MIAVIDYNMGNLQSVLNALGLLGQEAVATQKKDDLESAKAIILPGVGAFGDGMKNLKSLGLLPTLEGEVLRKKKPFLGLCLGMQLLAATGTEYGSHKGLGWVQGVCDVIRPESDSYKIPHMGWNNVEIKKAGVLFKDIEQDAVYYFVHSYSLRPEPSEEDLVTSTCFHGEVVVASIEKGNIFGVQFHPEKSQGAGLKLLENFVSLC
ncbi:MAG: imidazole glycerol phosphate synthase, glutamine amidotransferase subunit [Candidatus Wildermuthbacteria bacterium RIFCSPLOWO2_01_FULL_47_18]|uniref:Imidazole glycerol phosphate synthase subunit HisH n=1 Tax=Candidatus Wildermuthbacteria bacterium RIFCSPLOWO2_01_FULL_47_18 TaxID=1802460 RepID=A0A1G2RJ66_9BACT|nr:MAG: imidazole glycerol phosphate synthase, glutamine amidotransferase subunit [Candidatus Wildermuthbacteria bacterium RIFCSPLOWO2_01_FULL_47_18]